MLPGGVANPEPLRGIKQAMQFVRSFVDAGATCVDEASVTDQNTTTGRRPGDIPKFNEAMLHLFEETRTAPRPSHLGRRVREIDEELTRIFRIAVCLLCQGYHRFHFAV